MPEWAQMWGAKVKMPTDMRDDMLRDAIETSRDALDHCGDFEAEGVCIPGTMCDGACSNICCRIMRHSGLSDCSVYDLAQLIRQSG